MATQRYFPQAEADRIVWLNHYAAKLSSHSAQVSIGDAEVADTLADIKYYVWILHTWYPAIQQLALQATQVKINIGTGDGSDPYPPPPATLFSDMPPPRPPGVLNRLFNQVQRIKLAAGYDDSIGADLGVVGSSDNSTHPVPLPTATAEQGPKGQRVRIDYNKYGHDGVAVESRVNGGAWQVLGVFTQRPAYDESPLAAAGVPETRDYRLRWVDKDVSNGEYSAIVSAVVGV
jgi:hypothetical protein